MAVDYARIAAEVSGTTPPVDYDAIARGIGGNPTPSPSLAGRGTPPAKNFGPTGCAAYVKDRLNHEYRINIKSLSGLPKAVPGTPIRPGDVLYLRPAGGNTTQHWVMVNPDGQTVSEWVSSKGKVIGERSNRTVAELSPRLEQIYRPKYRKGFEQQERIAKEIEPTVSRIATGLAKGTAKTGAYIMNAPGRIAEALHIPLSEEAKEQNELMRKWGGETEESPAGIYAEAVGEQIPWFAGGRAFGATESVAGKVLSRLPGVGKLIVAGEKAGASRLAKAGAGATKGFAGNAAVGLAIEPGDPKSALTFGALGAFGGLTHGLSGKKARRLAAEAEMERTGPEGPAGNAQSSTLNVQRPTAERLPHGKPGGKVEIQWMKPEEIGVDPEVQYKKEGIVDFESNVTDLLKGVKDYDVRQGRTLTVWDRDATNRGTVLAHGHHRGELAKRAERFVVQQPAEGGGTQAVEAPRQIPVEVLKESEGWTLERVRGYSAIENIRDQAGSALDAAVAIRDLGITPRQLVDEYGVSPTSNIFQNLKGLLYLDEKSLEMVKNGHVPEPVASAIGETTRDNIPMQIAGLKRAADDGLSTYMQGDLLVRNMRAEDIVQRNQGAQTSFWDDPDFVDTSGIQAKIQDGIISRVKRQRTKYLKPLDTELLENEYVNAEARRQMANEVGPSQGAVAEKFQAVFEFDEEVRNAIREAAGRQVRGEITLQQAIEETIGRAVERAKQPIGEIGFGRAANDTGAAQGEGRVLEEARAMQTRAEKKQPELDAIGRRIAVAIGGDYEGNLKTPESLTAKAVRKRTAGEEYSVESAKDHTRGKIVLETWDRTPEAIRLLRQEGFGVEISIDRPMNGFGYRGINLTRAMGEGINGEIQVHTPDSWALKEQTDVIYRKWRDYTKEQLKNLSPELKKQYKADVLQSKNEWTDYWSNIPEEIRSAISESEGGRPSVKSPTVTSSAGTQEVPFQQNGSPSPRSQTSLPSDNRATAKSEIETGISAPPAIDYTTSAQDVKQGKFQAGVSAQAVEVAMPAEPRAQGRAAKEPVSLHEIVRGISKRLEIPMRKGRFRQRAAGVFKERAGVIRSKSLENLYTVLHETGHWLDKRYKLLWSGKGTPAPMQKELLGLGQETSKPSYTSSQIRKEGIANFVRRWTTEADHTALKADAPWIYAEFEQRTMADPKVRETLSWARGQWREYEKQSTYDQMAGTIVTDAPKEFTSLRDRWNRAYTGIADRFNQVRLFQEEAIKRHPKPGDLTPEDLPYEQLRLLMHEASRGAQWITGGAQNAQWETIGPSLQDYVGKLSKGQLQQADVLLKARRIRDWWDKKPTIAEKSGFTKEQTDLVISEITDPDVMRAADGINKINDQLLQYKVDLGLISPETAQVLRDTENFYAPLRKASTPGVGEESASGTAGMAQGRGKLATTQTGIRRLKGGTEPTFGSIQQTIGNIYESITLADKHAAVDALGRLADSAEGIGGMAEGVPLPMKRVPVPKEAIEAVKSEALAAMIASGIPEAEATALIKSIGKDLMPAFRPNYDVPGHENMIAFRRGDEIVAYQLDADLYKALQIADPAQLGMLGKILFIPQYVLRTTTTEVPSFAVANAIKDVWEYPLKSRGGVRPNAMLEGIFNAFHHGDLFDDFQRAGADYGGAAAMMPEKMKLALRDITSPGRKQIGRMAKQPLRTTIEAVNASERIPKLAEFQRQLDILEKTHPEWSRRSKMIKAGYEAADLMDFLRTGASADMQILRKGIAFFNPAIQGLDRVGRMWKENPAGTLAKGTLAITVPVMLNYMRNRNNPYYWARPQTERDMNVLVAKPNGRDFWRIPLPFENGFIFGTLPLRAISYIDGKDPEALDAVSTFRAGARVTLPPGMPSAIGPLWDVRTNKAWYGGPIVSPFDQEGQLPEEQFGPHTSLTMKKLGRLIHQSPSQLEYLARGYLSRAAEMGLEVSDKGIAAKTGEKPPERTGNVLFRRFSTQPSTQSPEVERFYDSWDMIQKVRASIRRASKEERAKDASGYAKEYRYSEDAYDILKDAGDAMGELREKYRQASSRAAKQDIALRMQKVAVVALRAAATAPLSDPETVGEPTVTVGRGEFKMEL